MCVGHPKRHPCQHMSVTFLYCVSAQLDRATGSVLPCARTTYSIPVDSDAHCTNQLCYFLERGGVWNCCQCHQGPNLLGWCIFNRPRIELNAATGQWDHDTVCNHCCCRMC
ncbi:hypothetical protein M406DRAFT_223852, partial [Cryphonectria parasitica EP155]